MLKDFGANLFLVWSNIVVIADIFFVGIPVFAVVTFFYTRWGWNEIQAWLLTWWASWDIIRTASSSNNTLFFKSINLKVFNWHLKIKTYVLLNPSPSTVWISSFTTSLFCEKKKKTIKFDYEIFLEKRVLPKSQETKSNSDNSTSILAFDTMQNLSVIDSTAPNAQQLPHSAWLRMVPMVLHFGHAERESKVDGVALTSSCG